MRRVLHVPASDLKINDHVSLGMRNGNGPDIRGIVKESRQCEDFDGTWYLSFKDAEDTRGSSEPFTGFYDFHSQFTLLVDI